MDKRFGRMGGGERGNTEEGKEVEIETADEVIRRKTPIIWYAHALHGRSTTNITLSCSKKRKYYVVR